MSIEEEKNGYYKIFIDRGNLQSYPTAQECFQEMGMHCVSCHMSPRETLEQACQVHQCDVDALIEKLDRHINGPQ